MQASSLFRSRAFTLVEIMIVVLIIGILLAIAIPNFVAARESSRAKSCIGNLKQIESAKQQAIMDNSLTTSSTFTFSIDGTTPTTPGPGGVYQLVTIGTSISYIRRMPVCPSAGVYSVGTLLSTPACSITGTAGSGYAGPTGTTPAEKWYHGY